MIVDATRIETTRGTYMGEEGTGYHFGAPAAEGDFSRATRGHIEGSTRAAKIEILVPGAEVFETDRGIFASFPPGTRTADGWELPDRWTYDAGECISFGLARVVE
jgi:hypothetical protein